jgi:2-polyprenyl-6-methoxyphenol hydroxylase-like FAD-dependent oxidoreductase
MRALQGGAESRDVELPRGDLAAILYEASRDCAEFLFNDSIVALSQDENGVDVTFDRAHPRRFDLVIGSDGLHSAVRRLGEESTSKTRGEADPRQAGPTRPRTHHGGHG